MHGAEVILLYYLYLSVRMPSYRDRIESRKSLLRIRELERRANFEEGRRMRLIGRYNKAGSLFGRSKEEHSMAFWNPRNRIFTTITDASNTCSWFHLEYMKIHREIGRIHDQIHHLRMERIARRWK